MVRFSHETSNFLRNFFLIKILNDTIYVTIITHVTAVLCACAEITINSAYLRDINRDFFFHVHNIQYFTRVMMYTHRHVSLYLVKSYLDCEYTFPIDLTPNLNPFGVKSIG